MNAADLLSKFRRMPYLIGRCAFTGCNRPAKFIEKGAPFKKLCERCMQKLCAGAEVAERLVTARTKPMNLDALGETDEHGDTAGPGDFNGDEG